MCGYQECLCKDIRDTQRYTICVFRILYIYVNSSFEYYISYRLTYKKSQRAVFIMASIAGEYDWVELYMCELVSLQTVVVCSESLLEMTYLQTIRIFTDPWGTRPGSRRYRRRHPGVP